MDLQDVRFDLFCSCIGSTFVNPVGSVRVEVETGTAEEATEIPPNIIDTSIKVIKVDGNAVGLHPTTLALTDVKFPVFPTFIVRSVSLAYGECEGFGFGQRSVRVRCALLPALRSGIRCSRQLQCWRSDQPRSVERN